MLFDECPYCGQKSTFMTTKTIYECENCGTKFCYDDQKHECCPNCKSENFEKIGVAKE
jgi:ribosomal protein L37AE/L43A